MLLRKSLGSKECLPPSLTYLDYMPIAARGQRDSNTDSCPARPSLVKSGLMIPYRTNPYQNKIEYLQSGIWPWVILGGLLLVALIVALVVAVLLLPPISLLTRLDPSYTQVGLEGNTLRDADGMQLTFLPEDV